MSALHRHGYDERDRSGRYRRSELCDGCNKPIGTAYFTDADVCGGTDGPGFLVCDRARCGKALDGLSVKERRAHYTAKRSERGAS